MNKPKAPVVAVIVPSLKSAARKQLPMLPWFPRDFMAATRGWPLVARAIYRELLDAQWDLGGLSADAEELRLLIGASAGEWKHWARVEPKFPIGSDGQRRNLRLEEHRARSAELSRKRSDAGRRGANARWPESGQ